MARSSRRMFLSHVLLSGSTDRFPELRTQLTGWGLTVGSFGDRGPDAYPDLVLFASRGGPKLTDGNATATSKTAEKISN